jgi:hypothetical protein
MTAFKPAPRTTSRPVRDDRPDRTAFLPPVPDKQLWEADKTRAFEAGARWFLAVSRAA